MALVGSLPRQFHDVDLTWIDHVPLGAKAVSDMFANQAMSVPREHPPSLPSPDTPLPEAAQETETTPWWQSQFFAREPVLFGTWDGVFTSCLINIFGVVIFLRTGWMVGNVGVLLSVVMVFLAIMVALVTVMSGIGICERCKIGSGGTYYMISIVLGSRVGGTTGLLYVFGQSVVGALYVTGFAESVLASFELTHVWAVRGLAVGVLLGLLAINLAGVIWVIRLQLVLLVLLAVSMLDFVTGSFTHLDPENGFVGYSEKLLRNNTFPEYLPEQSFFTVFGVFFPTATGVMAVFNMSGDLNKPFLSIPVGSLCAIAITLFLYLVFVLLLGSTCTRDALHIDFMIAEKVSLVGFLFLIGLYISSLASCMTPFYGAPRILQCIAEEHVIPAISFLAKGVTISSQVRVMVTMDVGMEVSQHDQSWLGWLSNLGRSEGYDLWLIGCLVLGLLLVVYADYLSKCVPSMITGHIFGWMRHTFENAL
uniref:solute carrier family 12 member 8-like n=1 Tax=Myxine glutinosa TaxID=7769 RepID=UPI00358F7852